MALRLIRHGTAGPRGRPPPALLQPRRAGRAQQLGWSRGAGAAEKNSRRDIIGVCQAATASARAPNRPPPPFSPAPLAPALRAASCKGHINFVVGVSRTTCRRIHPFIHFFCLFIFFEGRRDEVEKKKKKKKKKKKNME